MTSDLSFQIHEQIKYYFSDINLRTDKFLKGKIAENADGWVDISVLSSFNRLKSMIEGTDATAVVDAMEKHCTKDDSTVIELSEDKTKIRRIVPFVELTEEQIKELNDRSVHFKGFPQDASLDDIRKFCAQFGTVESVDMRRFREDRKFKGCVHVIYSNSDEARKAVESTEVYSADIKFLRESKVDYLKRKAEFWAQRNARKLKKSDQASELSTGNDDQDPVKVKSCVLLVSNVPSDLPFSVIKETMKHHGSVQYVDIDSQKKTATVRFSKENEAISVLKTAAASTAVGKDAKSDVEDTVIDEKVKVKVEASTNSNDKTDENTDNQAEKENGGQGETAAETVTKGEIVIDEKSYQAEVLAGEAEVDYWRALNEFRRTNIGNVNRNKHFGKKGRGFKRGGGGYKGNRSGDNYNKRGAGDQAAASDAKKVKIEA